MPKRKQIKPSTRAGKKPIHSAREALRAEPPTHASTRGNVVAKKVTKMERLRPEIRQLYKPEPPRKTMLDWEASLVNLIRKLDWDGKIQVYIAAERLAMARIRASIARRSSGAQRRGA